MTDTEALERIRSCFEHDEWAEGLTLCDDLATDDPQRAANVFAAYRPSIVQMSFVWAKEVNSHLMIAPLPDCGPVGTARRGGRYPEICRI